MNLLNRGNNSFMPANAKTDSEIIPQSTLVNFLESVILRRVKLNIIFT